MAPYEHDITGKIIVNSSDDSINSKARYVVVKYVDNELWYYTSTDDYTMAVDSVKACQEFYPTFLIDRKGVQV